MQAIIDFFKRLFGIKTDESDGAVGPGPTTSMLGVQTAGDLGPLGQFVLALTCNEAARTAWLTNRAEAIANSGLNGDDQGRLTAGNATAVASQIVTESGGTGSRIWICVWIK